MHLSTLGNGNCELIKTNFRIVALVRVVGMIYQDDRPLCNGVESAYNRHTISRAGETSTLVISRDRTGENFEGVSIRLSI